MVQKDNLPPQYQPSRNLEQQESMNPFFKKQTNVHQLKRPGQLPNMEKDQTIQEFLEEHYRFLNKKTTNNQFQKDLETTCSELVLIKENLNFLIKALKFQQNIKDLELKQIFEISNKVVELDESQIFQSNVRSSYKGGSPNVSSLKSQVGGNFEMETPINVNELFELASERKLKELAMDDDDSTSSEEENSDSEEKDVNQESSVKINAIDPSNKNSQATLNQEQSSNTIMRRKNTLVKKEEENYDDEYTQGYTKAKKLFKKMHKKTDEMRQEQVQYILNTFKILVLFLVVISKLNLLQPNEHRTLKKHKLIQFLFNLDQRIKITTYILIQRMADDEELHKVAQEAVDMKDLAVQFAKSKKYQGQDEDRGGGMSKAQELNKNMYEKKKRNFEDLRKKYDQFGVEISVVDEFLLNEFRLVDLIKIKLDFLSILYLKKDFMSHNFDIKTNIELNRFDQQKDSLILMDEYVKDLETHAGSLSSQGLLDLGVQDPAKMFFQNSIKNLILGNRITGPALCNDNILSKLFKDFYSSSISMQKDYNNLQMSLFGSESQQIKKKEEQKQAVLNSAARGQTTSPSMFNGGQTLNNEATQDPTTTRNQNTDPTSVNVTEHTQGNEKDNKQNDSVIIASSPQASQQWKKGIMSSFNERRASAGVFQSGNQQVSEKDSNGIQLNLCNQVLSCDLLAQNISKDLFQNNLPMDIKNILKLSLLTVTGKTPPQFVKENFHNPHYDQIIVDGADPGRQSGQTNLMKSHQASSYFKEGGAREKSTDNNNSSMMTRGGAKSKAGLKMQNSKSGKFTDGDISAGESVNRTPHHHDHDHDHDHIETIVSKPVNQLDLADCNILGMSPFTGVEDPQQGQTSQLLGTASNLHITGQSSFLTPQNQEVYSQISQRGKKTPMGGQVRVMENAQTFGKVSESHRDKTPKILSKVGSISGSTSICSQDLILLTDFVPLSELIQIFCKGQHDFDVYGSTSENESLLNIEKIEHLLTNMGKNDVELRKSISEQQFMEEMKSTFTYEMNSLKVERQSLERMMFKGSQGYLDQDMFIILLITSLFETQSISQIQQENDKFFEQPNQTDCFRLINIQFDQLIDENFGNNFSASEQKMTHAQQETFEQMEQSDSKQSQVLQIVHVAKQFLSGVHNEHRQLQPLLAGSSLSRLGQDLAQKKSKKELVKANSGDKAQSMISLFNQLMIHQILQKKLYEQQVLNTSRIIKIQYQSVLEIQKLYVHQIIRNYKNPGDVFDFTNLATPGHSQDKIKFAQYDPNTGLNTIDNTFQEQEQTQLVPIPAGQDIAIAENQEYLENRNINQEFVQAQNQFNSQVLKLQNQKQKFLQKLIYQIASNHIVSEKIMLLKTNILKDQKEEFLRQIETDDQVEVAGPKHKHRIEKNRGGNQFKFKVQGEDQLGDSASKGLSGNDSITLKGPQSSEIQMANINTNKKGISSMSLSNKGVTSPNSQINQSNEMGTNNNLVSPILANNQAENNEDNFLVSQTTVKGQKQKHENTIQVLYSDAKSLSEEEKKALFASQKRQSFTTEEKKKQKEAELMKEWEQARMHRIIKDLETILIQNDFKIAVYFERFFYQAQQQKNIKMLSTDLNKIEQLLYTCDLELLNQRKVLVTMLKSVENGMEDRENFIKDQLRQIAILEMQKGQEEDAMLDQTLKTIEIVNINDIGQEKDQLQYSCDILWTKKGELDKIEEDLQKERNKRDYKKSGSKQQSLKKRQTIMISKDQDDSPALESDLQDKSEFKLAAVPSGTK